MERHPKRDELDARVPGVSAFLNHLATETGSTAKPRSRLSRRAWVDSLVEFITQEQGWENYLRLVYQTCFLHVAWHENGTLWHTEVWRNQEQLFHGDPRTTLGAPIYTQLVVDALEKTPRGFADAENLFDEHHFRRQFLQHHRAHAHR
jgi:hypothetical protein